MSFDYINCFTVSMIILITDDFPLFFCQYEEFGDYIINKFIPKMRKSFPL